MSGRDHLAEAASAQPLSAADVEDLLGGDVRAVAGDPRAARTLLRRVRATILDHERREQSLSRDLTRALEGNRTQASPLAAAVATLGRLNLADQRQVFGAVTYPVLERLRAAIAAANAERLAARNAARRARLVLAQVAADESLPMSVRERVAAHQARLVGVADSDLPDEPAVPAAPDAPFAVPPAATGLHDLF